MADPLSVAGSAVGIVSLGLTTTQGLIQYYQAYRGQSEDVAQTITKLKLLLDLLESLQLLLNNGNPHTKNRDLLGKVDSYVKDSYESIQELEEQLVKVRKTSDRDVIASLRNFGRRLVYPLRKGTLQKLEDDIDDSMRVISLALQLLQNGNMKRMQDDLAALLSLKESASVSGDIRSWINAPDASINFNGAAKKKHIGTGSWFVEGSQFHDWLEKPASFLWIVGFAGCGKSVLMTTIIEHTQRHRQLKQGMGIAFFFFTFNDETKQNFSAMLRSIIFQLSSQLNQKDDPLSRLWRRSQLHSPTDQALLECLHQLVLSFKNGVYILLDALDESPSGKYRDEVLDAIAEMRDWGEPQLHLIVSSRDYSDIRSSLLRTSSDGTMIKMRNESIDKDIKNFVSQHLRTYQRFRKWNDHFDQIELALVDGAQGVFRWVECQFAALARCPASEYNLKRTLQSLPKSLDETYARMLRDVDSNYRGDVQRALTLLCCAKRPLLVEELMQAIAVELGDSPTYNAQRQLKSSEDLQQICAGFIDIDVRFPSQFVLDMEELRAFSTSGTHCEVVRIAHFSVQEFLKSDRIQSSKDFQDLVGFHVNAQDANDQMASTCLTFLLEPSILEPRNSVEMTLASMTLEYYAARYWIDHFDDCTASSSTRAQAIRLFCVKGGVFENWILRWNHDVFPDTRPAPLYFASLLGLGSIVYELIEVGIPKELGASGIAYSQVEPPFLNEETGYYGTALQAASIRGHVGIVQMLIEGGANINQRPGNYDSGAALHNAASQGHLETVKLLITRGANVNQPAGHYGTALQAASSHGYLEIVQLLIIGGANVDKVAGHHITALQAASRFGELEIVELLIRKGANIHIKGGYLGTALHAASKGGCVEVVQLLLRKGADINRQAGDYGTALHAASAHGHLEVVKLLLKEGANINQKASARETALEIALRRGSPDVVQLLIEEGADIDQESSYLGILTSALDGRSGTVQLLKARELMSRSCPTQRALQAATEHGHPKIVQLLLKELKQENKINQERDAGTCRLM